MPQKQKSDSGPSLPPYFCRQPHKQGCFPVGRKPEKKLFRTCRALSFPSGNPPRVMNFGFLLPTSSLSLQRVCFCFVFSSTGCGHVCPHVSLCFPDLCISSLLLAQTPNRKRKIYFIWPELHCSFLTTGVTSLGITCLGAPSPPKVRT